MSGKVSKFVLFGKKFSRFAHFWEKYDNICTFRVKILGLKFPPQFFCPLTPYFYFPKYSLLQQLNKSFSYIYYKLEAFVMSVDLTDKQDQKCIIFCDKLWYHWFHIIWEQNGANWVAQILRKF